jgi:nitrogen fixation protein NifQ
MAPLPWPPDPFDRHLFACAAEAAAGGGEGLGAGLGLPASALAAIGRRYFPGDRRWLATPGGEAPAALEEEDLRALLLDHRRGAGEEELWLAHVVARRSLGANHLWQDLGLPCRADLSELMRRHFPGLAAANAGDMKWKKFFYRALCHREGLALCKAPTCEACCDLHVCFAPEEGPPLSQMRQ